MLKEYTSEIIKMYTVDKMSTVEIANIYNNKASNIWYILKKNNIPIRSNKVNSRKYNVNDNYFENIDSENKAYWLGFLYADGCMSSSRNTMSLSLASKDKDHIVKFLRDIESDYPIIDHVNNLDVNFSKVNISSDKFYNGLLKNGCSPNKTFTITFPNLRNDLINHFIRGYFDGDGSISKSNKQYKFRLCGPSSMLNSVLFHIGFDNKLLKRWPNRSNDNFDIDIGGNVQVLKILNYIYKDATIYLDRKHKRYLELQSLYQVTDK